MRILWITNLLFPDIAKEIGMPVVNRGGWMTSLLDAFKVYHSNVDLYIATVQKRNTLLHREINGVNYYILPLKRSNTIYQPHLEMLWKELYSEIGPDVVHIHGTEYPHGLAFLKACPHVDTVISIQGLVSECSHFYDCGISFWEKLYNLSIGGIILQQSMFQRKWEFRKRSRYEQEIIKRCGHVIGRTSWDKSHAWAINPSAKYHFCNEILRDSFFKHAWSYEACEPHTIFVSQANYPIKGFHQLLKAMPLILRTYPNAKIYAGGDNIQRRDTLKRKLFYSDYSKYISRLIRKFGLQDKVVFCGDMNEEEMCRQYLKSNVFVCPSSIENSSNSLGEAQILGMPYVVSYVGGLPDTMKGVEEWCYRFEDTEMLAYLVCKAFEVRMPFDRKSAFFRHDPKVNSERMFQIYNKVRFPHSL